MELTPKEKAENLFRKMLGANPNIQEGVSIIDSLQAKICALIAVDEIINSRPAITDSQIQYINYWNEVKQEINNL
jgi:hypothetical protein